MLRTLSKLMLGLLLVSPVLGEGFDSAAELHALFTSPNDRVQLDKLRASGVYQKHRVAVVADRPLTSEPLKVEMRGVLIKNGDKPIVWVNQGNTLHSVKIEDGVRVRPEQTDQQSKKVPVKIFNRTYRMKPGQVWTEADGKVSDGYQIK